MRKKQRIRIYNLEMMYVLKERPSSDKILKETG